MSDVLQTTARIPRPLAREFQKLLIDLDLEQTEAINEGLRLWIVYQHADKQLANILEAEVTRIRNYPLDTERCRGP